MKFLKTILASCFGVILAAAVIIGIGSLVIGRMVAGMNQPKSAGPNTVLQINLDKPIPERTNNVEVNPYEFRTDNILGLQTIVDAIEYAASDKNIKGIFLNINDRTGGQATSSVIRQALEEFKSSGKFIISYSNWYNQSAYYLGSVADKVYVNPLGGIDFRGFGYMAPFFKDMLDRLGIKAQVYYAGKFKSASEPFRRNDMSEESKLQVREYVREMYNIFLQDISDKRDVSVTELKRLADGYLIRTADDAVNFKLADGAMYLDQVLDELKAEIGLEDHDKLNRIGLYDYAEANPAKKNFKAKDKIAIVYAEGTIVTGNGESGNIGGKKYAKLFRKLREDDKVKAIVVRINSGGGSAMASEVMWRELALAREEGKTVISSMGDVAASGGYFMACASDSIFAEPNTVTGSIGVFSMIPSMENMFEDKAGIHWDSVKTAQFSLGYNPFFTMSPEHASIVQESVDRLYEAFLQRVAIGRNMSRDAVHEIAQGRVWTGKKALSIGLVDELGGLEDAVQAAANKAGLEAYRLVEYPVVKEPIQQLLEEITGKKDEASYMMRQQLGELYPTFEYLRELKEMQGAQARLPFAVDMH